MEEKHDAEFPPSQGNRPSPSQLPMSGSARSPQGHGTQNPTVNPRRAHPPQRGSSSSFSPSYQPQFDPRYQAGHYSSFGGLSSTQNADVPAQIGGHGEGSSRQQHQQQHFRQFDPTISQQFQQQPQGSLFDPNVGHLSHPVMQVPGGDGFPLLPPAQQQQHHHHQQQQQQQQPSWLQQQPAGQRKRKISMGDGVGEGTSKSRKFSTFQYPISLVPLQVFLSANKDEIIEQFKFSAGCVIGNINPEVIVDVPTGTGQSLIGGYFEELSVAHASGYSWAGDFDRHDMFVTEKGPTQCTIMKVPLHLATPENIDLDHISLMNCLLSWFEGIDGQRPPFFDELFERIRFPVTAEDPVGRDKHLYVLKNHPAFASSAKRRGFLEDFYKFYKTLSQEERKNFLGRTNHDLFEFIFHQLVIDDDFLLDIFWKSKDLSREEKRNALKQSIEGSEQPPYTSEDLYVAIYLRHLIVHGPEYSKVRGDYFHISLLELDLIGAHHFSWFLPQFMEELLEMVNKYPLLMDCWLTYVTREQPLSLSLWSTLLSGTAAPTGCVLDSITEHP